MNRHHWDFALPASFLETQRILNRFQQSNAFCDSVAMWNSIVSSYRLNETSFALQEYARIMKNFSSATFSTRALLTLPDAINSLRIAPVSSLAASVLPLIDTSAYATLRESAKISSLLTSLDLSWATEACNELKEEVVSSDSNVEELVTTEIREEMAEDISWVLSNPDQMQVSSKSKYLQWKERNPGFAALFLEILLPVILWMLSTAVSVWLAHPVKASSVYEEPASSSKVICNITIEQHVTVIGQAPYYHEVELIDPETGELVTGYIYKGNLVAVEEEPSAPEPSEENNEIDTLG